jgi:hypothetical protein
VFLFKLLSCILDVDSRGRRPDGYKIPHGDGDGEKMSPASIHGDGDGDFSAPWGRG